MTSTAIEVDFDALTKEWRDRERENFVRTAKAAKALLPASLVVTVGFEGSGDDGQFQEIEATENGVKVPLTNDQHSAVEDFVDAYLERHFAGWEINGGANGTVTINSDGISYSGTSYDDEQCGEVPIETEAAERVLSILKEHGLATENKAIIDWGDGRFESDIRHLLPEELAEDLLDSVNDAARENDYYADNDYFTVSIRSTELNELFIEGNYPLLVPEPVSDSITWDEIFELANV